MAARTATIVLTARDLASGKIKGLQGVLKALGGVAAAVGVYQIGRVLVSNMQQAVEAAGVQQDAEIALALALRNRGQVIDELMPKLRAQAAETQRLTGFGDEEIIRNQALLTSYGAKGEVLEKLTRASLDYAAAMDVSLETAFRNVGKTLGGLSGELGEVITDIAKLTNEQRKAGAAADVIDQIFGGAAQAKLRGYQGRIREMTGVIGDLREVGGAPLRDVFTAFLGEVLSPFVRDMTRAADETDDFKNAVFDGAIAVASLGESLEPTARLLFFFGGLAGEIKLKQFIAELELLGIAAPVAVQALLGLDVDELFPASLFGNLRKELQRLKAEGGLTAEDIVGGIGDGSGTGVGKLQDAIRAEQDATLRLMELQASRAGEFSEQRLEVERRRLEIQQAREIEAAEATQADITDLVAAHLLERQEIENSFATGRLEAQQAAALGRVEAELRAEEAIVAALEAGVGAVETAQQSRLALIDQRLAYELEALDQRTNAELASTETTEEARTEIIATWEAERTRLHAEAAAERQRIAQQALDAEQAAQQQFVDATLGFVRATFGDSKALALAEVGINTARAVTEIMAHWAWNPAVAGKLTAWAIATGVAQAATIAASDPGFQFGGIVDGETGTDAIRARVTRGELIADTRMDEARSILAGRAAIVPIELLDAQARGRGDTYIIQGDVLDGDRFFRRHAKSVARGVGHGQRLRTRRR